MHLVMNQKKNNNTKFLMITFLLKIFISTNEVF